MSPVLKIVLLCGVLIVPNVSDALDLGSIRVGDTLFYDNVLQMNNDKVVVLEKSTSGVVVRFLDGDRQGEIDTVSAGRLMTRMESLGDSGENWKTLGKIFLKGVELYCRNNNCDLTGESEDLGLTSRSPGMQPPEGYELGERSANHDLNTNGGLVRVVNDCHEDLELSLHIDTNDADIGPNNFWTIVAGHSGFIGGNGGEAVRTRASGAYFLAKSASYSWKGDDLHFGKEMRYISFDYKFEDELLVKEMVLFCSDE